MSSAQKIWTDGEAHTTVEHQRVATIAALADDRALDAILTPHSAQKRILPLSEETVALNPRLLVVPSSMSGAVQMLPAKLVAGALGAPHHIALAVTRETPIDSPIIGANTTAAARTDLVYAAIAYGVSVNGTRKVKDPQSGIVGPQTLNLEKAPLVQLGIVPGVAAATPTASLPADPGDGSAYNFALAAVSVPPSYTQGTPIQQAQITALWPGGAVPFGRVRRYRPATLFAASAAEAQTGVAISERWGFGHRVVVAFRQLSSTTQFVVDSAMDWRKRAITVTMMRAAVDSGQYKPAHRVVIAGGDAVSASGFTGTNGFGITVNMPGSTTNKTFIWSADTNTGALMVGCLSQIVDTTNGDNYLALIDASDRFDF